MSCHCYDCAARQMLPGNKKKRELEVAEKKFKTLGNLFRVTVEKLMGGEGTSHCRNGYHAREIVTLKVLDEREQFD